MSLFASTVEKNLALRLVAVLVVPMLFLSFIAAQQVYRQSQELQQQHLSQAAKDYGMQLAERINSAVSYRISASSEDISSLRLPLSLEEGNTLVVDLTSIGEEESIRLPLSQLTADIDFVDHISRCVSLKPTDCQLRDEISASATWELRLLSLYDTNTSIHVTTWLDQSASIFETTLLVELFPQLTALLLILALYIGSLFLRKLLKPLGDLKHGVRAITAGDLGYQVPTEGEDEFSELIIAEVDEAILSGSDLRAVSTSCSKALIQHCGVKRVKFCEPKEGEWRIYSFDHEMIRYEEAVHQEPDIESLIPGGRAFPILEEKKVAGWLVVDQLAKQAETRVLEVVRKLAVGSVNLRHSKELYQQANYDGLTGLLNRTSFSFQLARKIAAVTRSGMSGVVIFLDLDEFKKVNDSEGHSAGDRLLQVVAKRLSKCVRQEDIVARLGGDEFAIALDAFENELDLIGFLNRLITDIEKPIKTGKLEVPVKASIGVCLYPKDGNTVEGLLKNADIAMYKAKRETGSSFVFFNDSLNIEAERQMLIEAKLTRAIQDDKIEVYLQPKLDIRTGQIDSSEALSRWIDDELGFIPPDEFIAVAERAGLIAKLTNNIFANIGRLLRNDPQSVQKIAVNISPQQLDHPDFARELVALLHREKIAPSSIELEVTESNFMDNPQKVAAILQSLRDENIQISLDDFGTGYSSLNLLRQLPLDYLKIDKSFVDEITAESNARDLVEKIIEIAENLGIGVVAEGVETEEQLHLLDQMSCAYAQGYLISKPLPAKEAISFINQWNQNRARKLA